MQGRKFNFVGLLALPGMLWMFVFVVLPVAFLLVISFWKTTSFGIEPAVALDNYATVFSEGVYLRVLWQTLRIALVTTLLALLISYPMALFLARLKGGVKSILVLLLFLPFWTSYVVRSFVWLPMLGRNGLLNSTLIAAGIIDQPIEWFLFNEGAVYVGLVYVYTLFMTLPIYLSLDKQDPKLLEAACDLGAAPFRAFIRVTWPLSIPGVISGCVMVFLLSCGAYVTPQLLGGTSGVMFGNVIASQFLNANNWALGAALSVVLIGVIMAFVIVAATRLGLQRIFIGERL